MNARERMLGRLRSAAPSTADVSIDELDARIDAHYAGRSASQPQSMRERIDAMQTVLTAAHADVWCADIATWPAHLAARLAAEGVRNLLLDTTTPEGAALAAALPPDVNARTYAQPIEHWKAELFDTIDAGFTVARSGIASTGTLIVAPDAGTPRTVSLAPPLHIALVHAHTLHADLHAAAHAERWRDGMPTNLVLISGPSKTSDIQQTLAYGAHGPRKVWVVIVTDTAYEHEGATQ